jgi:hypothetical protein
MNFRELQAVWFLFLQFRRLPALEQVLQAVRGQIGRFIRK